MRYNISISQPLIDAAQKAAAQAGAKRGKPMPVSEWIREAIKARLELVEPSPELHIHIK